MGGAIPIGGVQQFLPASMVATVLQSDILQPDLICHSDIFQPDLTCHSDIFQPDVTWHSDIFRKHTPDTTIVNRAVSLTHRRTSGAYSS